MSETQRIVRILGGRRALGSAPARELDLVPVVRKGFPYRALESATEELRVSGDDLSRYLRLPRRTLARRREAARLSAAESERLLRLVRVAARAEQVLGGRDAALDWLRTANRGLGSVAPIELLDTDIGLEAVLDALGRIEHGVYG